MYLAMIGNIKNAKAINQHERQKAHSLLSNSLRYINKKYPNRIVAQFTLTIGDEFQGLLKSGTNLFEMMDTISLTMKTIGVDLYFGIGVGTIITPINPRFSAGIDGPAYWNARTALEELKINDDYGMNAVRFNYKQHPDEALINETIALGEYMKFKWTQSQLDLLAGTIEMGDYHDSFRQVDLAETMHLQPKALHKRVSLSGIKLYLRSRIEIERKMTALMDNSLQRGNKE